LKVSGKSGGSKEDPPEEMQHPGEEGAEEEKEEPMAVARLHGSGWNGRFQKALDGGKGKRARSEGRVGGVDVGVLGFGSRLYRCESDGLDGPI
jgi:hypothetical protein